MTWYQAAGGYTSCEADAYAHMAGKPEVHPVRTYEQRKSAWRLHKKASRSHNSIANFMLGRPECLLARFSISSKATFLSWMIMIV
jgi:hypothetical protein